MVISHPLSFQTFLSQPMIIPQAHLSWASLTTVVTSSSDKSMLYRTSEASLSFHWVRKAVRASCTPDRSSAVRAFRGRSRASTSASSGSPPRFSRRRRLKPWKLKSFSNACLDAGLSSSSSSFARGAPPFR